VNELAEGDGPDVFYVHNTWFPHHLKKVIPLTSTTLTPTTFPNTFVNVTANDFVQPDPADGVNKVFALPLYADTLALYYNKKDFEQRIPERGKPAPTWDAIKEEAARFHEQDSSGVLTHGEIALGRSDNLHLAADIIYNFLLQAGVPFYDSGFKQAQFASNGVQYFEYFLSFAFGQNKNYSWSTDLVSAVQPLGEIEAFLAGKVASIIGYSDMYQRFSIELKNVKSRNSSVISMGDIDVTPLPQLSSNDSDYKVWASYYGLAVSRNSKNSQEAWNFVQFLASQSSARLYHQKTKRPAARRDLIVEQKKEPITNVFVSQVGYANSFHIFDDQKFNAILNDAIQAAVNGQSFKEAFSGAQTKMNDLLKVDAPNGLYPKVKK
ncbi:MAG: hypothetical protein UY05_C0035G0006, partial [Candidatus Peregrinibacteria bacterium GW2011_GWA2_47_7]